MNPAIADRLCLRSGRIASLKVSLSFEGSFKNGSLMSFVLGFRLWLIDGCCVHTANAFVFDIFLKLRNELFRNKDHVPRSQVDRLSSAGLSLDEVVHGKRN